MLEAVEWLCLRFCPFASHLFTCPCCEVLFEHEQSARDAYDAKAAQTAQNVPVGTPWIALASLTLWRDVKALCDFNAQVFLLQLPF